MKFNLQKSLIIILVLSIVLMIFNIAAFADTEPSAITNKEYYASQFNLVDKYCDGDITFEQFQEQSQSVTNEYVNSNTVGGVLQGGALNVSNTMNALSSKIGATVDKYGDEARSYVSDWWSGVRSKNGVPTENTQTSNADMQGHGALLEKIVMRNGSLDFFEKFYCDYMVISYMNDNTLFMVMMYNTTRVLNNGTSNYFGNYSYGWFQSSKIGNYVYIGSGQSEAFFLYGDVRYQDGTPAPTNDEYTYGTIYKYDEMPEKQLEDLAKSFSDKMTLENPDLSNLEGLLNAIYARLGTLDADNDNELLSEILVAIQTLDGGSSDNDNSEIVSLLEDIKNSLVFEDGENTETFSEQLKIFLDSQITADDFIIDEDIYSNYDEILSLRLQGKFSFIDDMRNFVTYCFDTYKESANKPKIEFEINSNQYSVDFDYFEQFMPTLRLLLAAFIYITYAYHTYRKIPSYINGGDNE